jgi:acetyltransferase-like isoleucine patch superfamily enzyme
VNSGSGKSRLSTPLLWLHARAAAQVPPTRLFGVKRAMLRLAGAQVGQDVRIVSSARFCCSGSLHIGAGTWIGHEVLLIGGDSEIHIGARCDIAPRVMLVTGSHEISLSGGRAAGNGFSRPICSGDGCWIGAGAVVIGGSTIGEHSVVAAGAIVRGSFPARSLLAGVPARVVKTLGHDPTPDLPWNIESSMRS